MNISFYNGVSGLIAFQNEMNIIAHNMANVNTTGFKGSRVTFSDLLYTEMDTNGEEKHLTGHGVKAASVDLLQGQGITKGTNNQLDLAIEGEGFFAVEREGRIEYTRNGSFGIGLEGGSKGYLVTHDGAYVLDSKEKPIKLSYKPGSKIYNLENLSEKVGVFLFPNPYGLTSTEGSSFLESELSGEAYTIKNKKSTDLPYEVVQCAVEASNVQLPDQMTNLIVTQRAYQMNAKMVETADQIEEIVNNLR